MIIIGVDPGTAITGYGVIGYTGNKFCVYDYGCIKTDPGMELSKRLGHLYSGLEEVIKKSQPEHFAIEALFFNKNAKTALAVGHGRGVAMLAAVRSEIPVYEYTPLQVKQAVVGNGRAVKQQVEFMIAALLGIREKIRPDDAADALAVAVCHAFRWSGTEALKR